MKWHTRLKRWLEHEKTETLQAGERPLEWIVSMRQDLDRWNLPAALIIRDQVLLKGKVPVYFRRMGPVKL